MHVHPPKPLHGWKEFLNEIFVIVVGVLIALGLEQVVEQWHWHHEVADARETLHKEVGSNLVVLQIVARNAPCVDANLAELQRRVSVGDVAGTKAFVDLSRRGVLHFNQPSIDVAAWEVVRDSGLLAHMPPSEKLTLATTYGAFETFKERRSLYAARRSDAFMDASVYDGSADSRREVLHKLAEARGLGEASARAAPETIRTTEETTGIKPQTPREFGWGLFSTSPCVRFDKLGPADKGS